MGAIRLFTVFPRVHLQEGKNTPTEMGPRFAFGLDLVYKRCLLVFRSSHINVRGKRPSLPPICENTRKTGGK